MSKKVAYYGIFASLAILMGYIEGIFPMPFPIPGIKLGLSNVIVLMALYIMDEKTAFGVSIIRVFVSALLFRGFLGLWYSLAGAMLSFIVMVIAKRTNKLSTVGVSVLGGIFHNVGQIVIACIILGRTAVVYLLPILMVSGIITGFVIGVLVGRCNLYFSKSHN